MARNIGIANGYNLGLLLSIVTMLMMVRIDCTVTEALDVSTKIPPPPPLSMPVWSFAASTKSISVSDATTTTASVSNSGTSMNIVTFCTPVSIVPKLWAVSLYHDTLTKDSFLSSRRGVLQLLSPAQKHLVPILGKHSGYDSSFSKSIECSNVGMTWLTASAFVSDHQLLPHCVLYVQLEFISVTDAGDHVVAICKVLQTGLWDETTSCVQPILDDKCLPPPMDASTVLYSGLLRQEGII